MSEEVNMKEEFSTKLCDAIRTGDETRVKDILLQYPYGYISEEPFTDSQEAILYDAMLYGDLSMIQLLVDFGANVHLELDQMVFSNLSIAAYIGKQEMVEFLLEKGVDVNSMASDGCTALHLASCTGSLDIVNLLLERGAIVDVKTKFGLTALHGASARGHRDVVQVLLNHGANILVKDAKGKTPFIYAVGGGYFEIGNLVKIEILPCHGSDQSDKACSRSSSTGAKQEETKYISPGRVSEHKQTVEFLLQRGADVYDEDKNANSVLHYAIRSGYKSIIDLLLNHGARVCGNKVLSGKNLLTYAAENQNFDLVKLLLDNGANPNIGTARNYTPLHGAALYGSNDIVELLLDRGADIDPTGSLEFSGRNYSSATPLQCAVLKNHKSTAHLLLTRGADIAATVSEDLSVLHLAVLEGNKEMIKLLLKWGIEVDVGTKVKPLGLAFCYKRKYVAELLLDRGADLNLSIEAGFLATSKWGCCSEITQFFIKELVKMSSLNWNAREYAVGYSSDCLIKIKSDCEKEIEKLRKKTFPNTTTTYFSVYEKSPGELALLAANENVIQAISSEDFLAKKFPLYAASIIKCALKGVVRKEMQNRLFGFFSNLYKDEELNEPLPTLPEQCVDKIFDLLSNDDLKNLISEYRCSKNILTVDEY